MWRVWECGELLAVIDDFERNVSTLWHRGEPGEFADQTLWRDSSLPLASEYGWPQRHGPSREVSLSFRT